MKIRILSSASQDLIDGYRFYEMQAEGIGAYFLDSLYADIDSLTLNAVSIRCISASTIVCCQSAFHLPCTTESSTGQLWSMPYSIAGVARHGHARS